MEGMEELGGGVEELKSFSACIDMVVRSRSSAGWPKHLEYGKWLYIVAIFR